MKRFTCVLFVLIAACAGKEKSYAKADDALNAGREYISACMEGDFKKAAFYTVDDERNRAALAETEKAYREKDKEGRQQLRSASININGVKNMSDTRTAISYNYSFDKQPQQLLVVNKNGSWLVDLGKN
jgi:hypothetical protein